MFDIFKKLDDEQNNGEQNIAEQCENLEENREEMKTQEPFEKTEADVLGGEERLLLAEKSQLMSMEETLKQRISDEIEVKRHRIENLRYEIPELKQRCEALAKALDIPVQK